MLATNTHPSETPTPNTDIDIELTLYGCIPDYNPTSVNETNIADDKAKPRMSSESEITIVVQDDLPPADKGIGAWTFVSHRIHGSPI